ncbi:acyltransferase [Nonomuraea sp. NPDC000554]|uniref:acyltransferase family protein n=1 Tax=Nonomuraea sp. NPDC000554 TaxID=3154259 RepID=UPI0033321505
MVAELAGNPDEGMQKQAENVPKSKEAPKKARVPVLDGIRGVLALAVLLTHVTYAGGVMDVGEHKGWPVFNWLSVGLTVSLSPFFLLSGLLLYRPFVRATFAGSQRPPLKPFFVRRLLRILPGYWAVVAASLLLINLPTIDSLWDVLRPVLLLQWFVDTKNAMIPGMEITWSVDAELTFYLLLPLGAWLINKYARRVSDPAQRLRRIIWPLSSIVLLGLAWEVYVHLPFMGAYPVQMFWPPGFLGLMAIGMMFAALSAYQEATGREPAIYRLAAKSPLTWWAAAFGVYVLNCVKPFSAAGDGDYPPLSQALMDQILFLLFAVLMTVPLFAPGARSRFMDALLGNPVSRFLGRISYGIYLWHFPAMYFAFGMGNLFGTPPQPMFMVIGTIGFWQLIAEVLAITIILSTLTYYLVERPAARLGSRFLRSGVPTATS